MQHPLRTARYLNRRNKIKLMCYLYLLRIEEELHLSPRYVPLHATIAAGVFLPALLLIRR